MGNRGSVMEPNREGAKTDSSVRAGLSSELFRSADLEWFASLFWCYGRQKSVRLKKTCANYPQNCIWGKSTHPGVGPLLAKKTGWSKKVCTYERRLTTGHHRRNVRPFRLCQPEILGYFGKCWRNARMGSSVSCFFAGALCLYVMLCFFTKLLILLADWTMHTHIRQKIITTNW